MAIITAFAASWSLGGIDNANLSTDMDGFTADLWPPHISDMGSRGIVALISHHPVSQTPRIIPTFSARSFFDDFYNRIHVSPNMLQMGNILSTQTEEITVWNAYLTQKTLTAIDGIEGGMLVEGQPVPPLLFEPLAELTYDISVTQEGALSVDAEVSWVFDSYEAPVINITATRVTVWPFAPDWEDGVRERLEWRTEILASESMVEQRRAMRSTPRRTFNAMMYVEDRERQYLDLVLFAWSARIWVIPIWHEVQLLASEVALGSSRIDCDTEYLDFYAGGLAVLRGSTAFEFEGVEIEAIDAAGIDLVRPVQNTWQVGSRLYPARTAQLLSEPEQSRITDAAVSVEVDFLVTELNEWPAVMPITLYRGYPVLGMRPDENDDLKVSQARLLSTLDNESALPKFTDLAGLAMPLRGWKWLGMGRSDQADLRSLLYALRGRQVPLWIPTHADDLTVLATISASGNTIDVAWCGVTRFASSQAGRCDIRIELFNGTAYHRRITDSTELSSTAERIVIDAGLGANVEPSEIMRVSWMTLSRGSSDQVEIVHDADSVGIASCALTFRGVRDDAI